MRRHLSVFLWNASQRFKSDAGFMLALSLTMLVIYALWCVTR